MDDIIITKERIIELFPKHLNKILESDYSNPLKDAIEEAFKEQEGPIKKMVNEVLSKVLTTEEFKSELTREILVKVIRKGLNL